MFFLYYLWYFLFQIIFYFKKNIDIFYINEFVSDLKIKTTFFKSNFFKKFFLIFFYEKNLFNKYFLNISDEEKITYFRRRGYPNIYKFFLIKNKFNLNFLNYKTFIKQYNFFNKLNFFENFKKNFLLKNIKNNFVIFLILKKFLNKKYLIKWDDLNLTFVFFFFLKRSKKRLIFFNLENYNQWFSYCFSKKLKNFFFFKKINKNELEKLFRMIILLRFLILIKKYKKIYKNFKKNIFFFFFNFNKLKNSKIVFSKTWDIKNKYKIRFKETSINKFINLNFINKYSIMYLRKNKVFNKSRYSRNRQLYRTGVYWCIWLNIIIVFSLYFIFYRFLFNFGYIWWGIFILLYSSIFSRVLKYNFFNLYFIFKEFFFFIKWVGLIFLNLINFFFDYIKYLFFKINIYLKKSKKLNVIFLNKKIINFFFKKYNFRDSTKIVEFWHGLKEKDTSFLKYKTIIHWTKLFFKVLFY